MLLDLVLVGTILLHAVTVPASPLKPRDPAVTYLGSQGNILCMFMHF